MCSLHLTHPSGASDIAAPGPQLGVRCLAQGSHLSRVHAQPQVYLGFQVQRSIH